MVYGAGDSHTSYGPTRFRRSAAEHGVITLFGEGEECRDFVHVDDVARLVRRILLHESRGVLNLATGVSTSYARLADLVAAQFGSPIRIERVPRQVPVTHRAFDVAACRAAFPDFVFTSLEDGLVRAHRGAMDDPRGAERGAPE
jgi:nucleoside-diphosphate-sugar epimerase